VVVVASSIVVEVVGVRAVEADGARVGVVGTSDELVAGLSAHPEATRVRSITPPNRITEFTA